MICLEDTTDFVVFACKHEVCVICFPKIMNANPECPLCRSHLFQELEVSYDTRVEPSPEIHCRMCVFLAGLISMLVYLLYLGQTHFQLK